ncbi:MAG TPA: acetyl-CoA carboxylase biotin carboxyl carrier protein, partial [Roseimicrobium sp.]|nr:acetyl-CoA carboxylase biotin carboxyl carrier protein [Roseimicrobium sp.]
MKKNALSEFELEKQDFKIKLKRGFNGGGGAGYDDALIQAYLPPAGGSSQAQTPHSSAPAVTGGSSDLDIKSPMIGTVYRAPSPEAASYVEVGTEVTPETVVCIIEAMKVMNEIKAEVRGVVTQVCVDNAKPVEFGQPLFKVRPL